MEIDFAGKRALITGATRGIGRATARLIHKLGGNVVALCYNQDWLNELVEELPGIETIQVDLSDWNATETSLANIGPVDFLFNNAGVIQFHSLFDVTNEHFDKIANVNLKAIYCVTKVVAKEMIKNGVKGAIVNVSSVVATNPDQEISVYSALKAGMTNLTKSMAKELAPHQIRVNAVAPGVVDTEMAKPVTENKELMEKYMDVIPIKKLIKPDDVAKAVCFLLSDHASVITGIVLPVDAGYLLSLSTLI